MRKAGAKYVYWYNRKFDRVGGLFQDRYKSELVEDDTYFLMVLRYLHLNPVKAGICKTVSDYKESSYNDFMHPRKDQITDTEFTLRLLSRKKFPEFHNEGGDENCLEVQDIKRVGDSKAKAILHTVSQCGNVVEFQALPREKGDWCLVQLKKKGLSVRQIERLSGINRGVVQKADSERKIVVLNNLADLYVEKGDFDEALQCIAQAEPLAMEGTMRGRLDYICGLAEQRLTPEEFTDQVKENYFFEVEKELRLEVEEKKFTPESPLMRGLKNMPNEWLQNICLIHGIDLCRLRSEREKAITAYLTSPEHLKETVKELTHSEEDLLEYLLDKGGWAPLSSVSRKFGKMEGDGYYWDEDEPQSTTGMLWSKGLVVVGKAIVNNRLIKIVAIPVDLRVLVEDIFSL